MLDDSYDRNAFDAASSSAGEPENEALTADMLDGLAPDAGMVSYP